MVYRRTAKVGSRQERTRAAILQSAHELVGQCGLAGTSMAEVAASADVGVGTLYRYFPSKTDLIGEVVRSVCRRELEVVAATAAHDTGTPQDRLEAAVTVFAARALRSGHMAYAMIAEPTDTDVEILRLKIRAELAGIFGDVIADGVQAGVFPEQSPAISGAAVVGAVSEVLVGPLSPLTDVEVDAAILLDEIGRFAVRAVAPQIPLPIHEVRT